MADNTQNIDTWTSSDTYKGLRNDLLIRAEGQRSSLYFDTRGIPTIGVGEALVVRNGSTWVVDYNKVAALVGNNNSPEYAALMRQLQPAAYVLNTTKEPVYDGKKTASAFADTERGQALAKAYGTLDGQWQPPSPSGYSPGAAALERLLNFDTEQYDKRLSKWLDDNGLSDINVTASQRAAMLSMVWQGRKDAALETAKALDEGKTGEALCSAMASKSTGVTANRINEECSALTNGQVPQFIEPKGSKTLRKADIDGLVEELVPLSSTMVAGGTAESDAQALANAHAREQVKTALTQLTEIYNGETVDVAVKDGKLYLSNEKISVDLARDGSGSISDSAQLATIKVNADLSSTIDASSYAETIDGEMAKIAESVIHRRADGLFARTDADIDGDGTVDQTTTTDYSYSDNSADYQTSSTVTDADGKVVRSVTNDYSYNDLGEETRSEYVSDASGTAKTVYNDAGAVVSTTTVESGANNIGAAVGAAASFLGLVKALQAGKPLPIAVAGVNTLASVQQASTGSVNAQLSAAAAVGAAASSLYNLSVAYKQGDSTGMLAASVSSLYYGGTAYANVLGFSSVGEAAAKEAIGSEVAGAIGAAGQAMPYVNLVNDLAHGNRRGVAVDALCIVFPEAAAFLMVANTIFSMFKSPPEPWGNGNFAFNEDGSLRINAVGGDGGKEHVYNTLAAYQGQLQSIVASYNQGAPKAQIGLIANRMGSLSESDGQWTLSTLEPQTGGQLTLHYDASGKVLDAQVGSPEYFRSMGEQYIYSALQSGALAAQWEVQTAAGQSRLGDPMAGLTEEQRAQRNGQYLGAQHISSVGAGGAAGAWRAIGLDLNGDGIQTVTQDKSGVVFDVDGMGFAKQTAWVGKQDGMLVLDRNFNGVIDSGAELFGNTQVALGAQGLKGLGWVDANVDGDIDSQDPVYSQLRVWQDANGNALVDQGEARSLTDMGISAIHYNRGSYDKNGQSLQIGSVELAVDSVGTKVEPVAGGIKIESTDGHVSVLVTKTEDLSNLAPGRDGVQGTEDVQLDMLTSSLLVNDKVLGANKSLTITAVGNAQHGKVWLDDAGVHFLGGKDYDGKEASFTYTVEDANHNSAQASVSVGLTPVNDAPTVQAGYARTPIYGYIVDTSTGGRTPLLEPGWGVDANGQNYANRTEPIDYKLNPNAGKLLISDPDDTVFTITQSHAPQYGKVVLNADGSWVYTAADSAGSKDAFEVTVDDGHGGRSSLSIDVLQSGPASEGASEGGGETTSETETETEGAETESAEGGAESGGESEGGAEGAGEGEGEGEGEGGPLVLDLDRNGITLLAAKDSQAFYDIKGDGWRYRTGWTTGGDGFLAYDANGDGQIAGKGELSFTAYKANAMSDLEGLQAFDSNGDGKISALDKLYDKLRVWRDANGNGVSETTELQTLAQASVKEISLQSNGQFSTSGGNVIHGMAQVTLQDSSTIAMADVTLAVSQQALLMHADGSSEVVTRDSVAQGGEIAGSSADDMLVGGVGSDHIAAQAGNDFIADDQGNDVIEAGAGKDVVYSGADNDVVLLGAGDDAAFAGMGDDLVMGDDGQDAIFLEAGNDVAFGGDGNDLIDGGAGADVLSGDAGDDQLVGQSGQDALFGGDGNDALLGGDGNDTLQGDAGDDVLDGGAGADQMAGGVGDDTYVVDDAGDRVTELAGEGHDLVKTSLNAYRLAENLEDLTLSAQVNATNPGSDTDSTVPRVARVGHGNDADNHLLGNAYENTLYGGAGNDTLDGWMGKDTLLGGAGNDVYVVDNAGDVVTELAGEGVDLVKSSVNHTLGAFVENLTLTGTVALSGTGNELDNVLTANAAGDTLSGAAGNDTLFGGAGADRLDGGSGADALNGGAGNDSLQFSVDAAWGSGAVLSNATNAAMGAQVSLMGKQRSLDQFNGGAGVDTVLGTAAADVLLLDDGVSSTARLVDVEVINVGAGDDVVDLTSKRSAYGAVTVDAGDGSDVVWSASGNDWLLGGAGNDVLDGGAGNDTVDGGVGTDTLYGGAGDDTLQFSVDTTWGSGAVASNPALCAPVPVTGKQRSLDQFNGGAGVDTVLGTAAADVLFLDDGVSSTARLVDVEVINVGAGDDVVDLTSKRFAYGAVTVDAGDGSDVVWSASGNDWLLGGAGNDVLDGGAGNDTVDGGVGVDTLSGGAGDDMLQISADTTWGSGAVASNAAIGVKVPVAGKQRSLDQFNGGAGVDTVLGTAAADVLSLDDGDGNTARVKDVEVIRVGAGDDLVDLTSRRFAYGAVTVEAGEGNDMVWTAAGNDWLDGGQGADALAGGAGNDTYVVDSTGDVVTELACDGVDLVKASVSHALRPNVENLTLTGTGALAGTGNELNNVLTANDAGNTLSGGAGHDTLLGGAGSDVLLGDAGNDWLDGGLGADKLSGGAGDDTYVVDNTGDVITELAAEGVDLVRAAANYALGANLENLTLTGSGAWSGTGNESNNVLTANDAGNLLSGGAGHDTLVGGVGVDTLVGGAGNDTYVLNNGADLVKELTGEGVDLVKVGVGYVLGANLENLTLTGNTALAGTGNELDNVLTANDAGNTLAGLAGNDVLMGGAGADTLLGGDGVDRLSGGAGQDLLDGGAGADALAGGAGNDTYVVDNASDTVTELAGEGADLVKAGVAYTLGANVENLTLTGSAALNGTGNDLDNVLTANDAGGSLMGLAGNDTLLGGAGNDVLDGGAGADALRAGGGNDVLQLSADGVHGNTVARHVLTGATVSVSGKLRSLDFFDGGSGMDILRGTAGADALFLDDGVNTTARWANVEQINVAAGDDVVDLTSSRFTYGDVQIDGGDGNDVIWSAAGNDALLGGAGNDVLDGGAGADTLTGGLGSDTYMMARGYGLDMVQDYATDGGVDVLRFAADIGSRQLWFTRSGNDLQINVIGSGDKAVVQNWYLGSAYQVEQFKAGDGKTLLNTQVNNLVSAMAAFAPPAAGQTNLATNYQNALSTTLAASWK